jgi:prephenate dehydrogenase
MSTKIALIGLGQVGASAGLALGTYKDQIIRIGHDGSHKRMKELEKAGVFDSGETKLAQAVQDADLVIIDLPVDMVRDGMQLMADNLKSEAVIICFSSVVQEIYKWAREILPANQAFIVVHPVIDPDRLADWNDTLLMPHADLFENCDMVIAADAETQPRALKMATDLCGLLKAKPYFSEPLEADGILARTNLLPILNATAFLNTLLNSTGWGDARRITSRGFFRTASISMLYDESEYFGISGLLNRENSVRVLDEMVAELQLLREMLQEGDEEGLRESMNKARRGYEGWLYQRTSGDWDQEIQPESPESRNIAERLFGGKTGKKKDNR